MTILHQPSIAAIPVSVRVGIQSAGRVPRLDADLLAKVEAIKARSVVAQ